MSGNVTSNPTWEGDPGQDNGIRHMFTDMDIDHMKGDDVLERIGTIIELDSYENVKLNAIKIYGMVKNGRMPPDDPWPDDMVLKFKAWMDGAYPKT